MLTSRVSSDAATLQEFLVRSLPYLVINVATLIGIFAVMFAMSPVLALAILLPVPAVWAWGFLFWRRMTALFERWQRANARFSSRLNQSVSSIRIVKAFGQEVQQAHEFEGYNEELRRTNLHVSRNRAVLLATMGLITSCGMLTLWLFGGWKVIRGELTLGVVLSFYGYILLFYGPLQWFGQVSSWMTQAFTGAQRIFEILDEPKEQYDGPDAVPMPAIEGRVTFRKVEFGYESGRAVLRDIDLDVAPGEMIGVAGQSGAGKTTAMNLVCRFYDVAAARFASGTFASRSVLCHRSRSYSVARSPKTSATDGRERRLLKLSKPERPLMLTNSSYRSRMHTTARSGSGAAIFPAARGSASRLPERFCVTRGFSFLTRPRRQSMFVARS